MANFQCFLLINKTVMCYFQLDLRVNHTLIRDQFLWVSFNSRLFHLIFSIPPALTLGFIRFEGFQDLNNFESDPEEFAKTFCADLGIQDPEVGVSHHISFLNKCKGLCQSWNIDVFSVC